jgi:hypothetical protein
MQDFIHMIVDIALIELSLGPITMTIGQLFGSYLLIRLGANFFDDLLSSGGYGSDGIDDYINESNDEIRDRIDREATQFWDDYYGR